jgi:hypothetical protein
MRRHCGQSHRNMAKGNLRKYVGVADRRAYRERFNQD